VKSPFYIPLFKAFPHLTFNSNDPKSICILNFPPFKIFFSRVFKSIGPQRYFKWGFHYARHHVLRAISGVKSIVTSIMFGAVIFSNHLISDCFSSLPFHWVSLCCLVATSTGLTTTHKYCWHFWLRVTQLTNSMHLYSGIVFLEPSGWQHSSRTV
jgi:hypothetical protein